MSGASIKIALLATFMVIALISALSGPASAVKDSPTSGPRRRLWPNVVLPIITAWINVTIISPRLMAPFINNAKSSATTHFCRA